MAPFHIIDLRDRHAGCSGIVKLVASFSSTPLRQEKSTALPNPNSKRHTHDTPFGDLHFTC